MHEKALDHFSWFIKIPYDTDALETALKSTTNIAGFIGTYSRGGSLCSK
jgi:hypothetical protein